MQNSRFSRVAAFSAALALTLAACATRTPAPAAPPAADVLTGRVRTFWENRQRKDLGAMYAFYSAGYRSRHPREEFLKKSRLTRFDILEFRVADVSITEGRADVTIAYRAQSPPKIPGAFESTVKETWILDPDHQWYRERETILLPFPGATGALQEAED
ncbi:MAG: hypothetical protein ABI592_08555 [Acidobacteriota bacterium]